MAKTIPCLRTIGIMAICCFSLVACSTPDGSPTPRRAISYSDSGALGVGEAAYQASRLVAKCGKFFAWKPDQEARAKSITERIAATYPYDFPLQIADTDKEIEQKGCKYFVEVYDGVPGTLGRLGVGTRYSSFVALRN